MTSLLNYDQAAHEWALHEDGYDEGMQQGIQLGILRRTEQSVKNLMDSMNITLNQALDALKINGEERDAVARAVQGD